MKNKILIPLEIRPYLIPFLFKEFSGISANIKGKEVKAVKISTRNSFGKIIRLMARKSDFPNKIDKRYSVYLCIKEYQNKTEYFGKVYRYTDGRNCFLKIPKEGVDLINDHLESLFRSAMMYFLDGWSEKKGDEGLKTGINIFFSKYRLLEFGFDPESMRRTYYRWKKTDKRLSFFTNQAPSKSMF